MTIHDPEKYCAGLWDWAILDGCFGNTRIRPTDIDGFVERNGRLLVIETKSPRAQIPHGQWITFNELLKTGVFTIMVVWGNTNKPQAIQVMGRNGINDIAQCDLKRLREWVSRWYMYADGI